ncbi:MAG: hypothetical protein NT044_01275 [Micrococcales bacterium]|nr:hypothetical protein [Micrococcales bacterium]
MTKPNYGETIRLTMAQAVVLFIANQYSVSDLGRQRFVTNRLLAMQQLLLQRSVVGHKPSLSQPLLVPEL